MREILFRAKRIDYDKFPKEEWWIEGNAFVHDDGRTVDISTGTEKFSIKKRVIPETLCQYTGLTDKNGKRIWENDIVEDKRFNGFYKIVFRVRDGGWYVENIKSSALFRIIERTSCQYERCGNIFDNPELLKRRTDMLELEKLGKVMSVVMDNCDNCPLEKICSSSACNIEWQNFFESKVKEDGIEECRN